MANFGTGCSRAGAKARQEGSVAEAATGVFFFDKLNLIAVRIFHKRDNGSAAFYRARFTRHVAAVVANALAGLRRVFHANGDVAVSGAELIALHAQL